MAITYDDPQVEILTSDTTIYTSNTGLTGVVVTMVLSNSTAASRNVNIHLVKPGDTPTPTNRVLRQGVPASGDVVVTRAVGLNVKDGGLISMIADAAGVTVNATIAQQV
jgi:hypothetical protein